MPEEQTRESIHRALVTAIERGETVRLLYENKKKAGLVSLHEVAPIDLRPGETGATRSSLYLWAWCFAENKPETHLLDRVRRAVPTDQTYDTTAILANWKKHWPPPEDWVIPRLWTLPIGENG